MTRLENLLGALTLGLADQLSTDEGSGSASEKAALVSLAAHPGWTVSRLAEVLGLTSSGATRLVERLVAAGWVERSPGPDGRQRRLWPTPDGVTRAGQIVAARRARLAALLATLTPAERDGLEVVAGKLVTGLADGLIAALRVCRLCDRDVCRAARGAGCPLGYVAED